MTDVSIFEIIGPSMIGPSSSHTAGMARIGRLAGAIINEEPQKISIKFHQTIKYTYKGHGSDIALIGGLLGISEDSTEIKNSCMQASRKGIDVEIDFIRDEGVHPNTAVLRVLTSAGEREISGISIGGGSFLINAIDGHQVNLGGSAYHLLIWGKTSISQSDIENIFKRDNLTLITSGFSVKADDSLYWCSLAEDVSPQLLMELRKLTSVIDLKIINPVLPYGVNTLSQPLFKTGAELLSLTQDKGITLAEAVIQYEVSRSNRTKLQIKAQMLDHLMIMRQAMKRGLSGDTSLVSGLTSGVDGRMLAQAVLNKKTIGGDIVPMAIAGALAVMEVNGSMGRVVAAPTAGSCGIVPGCLLTIQDRMSLSDEEVEDALFVAAGIGVIIAHAGASFSGVVGGCQGEVGVSSALAAAALVKLGGGTAHQMIQASALALKNILGLICDPIAGPVEVPCIKRNAIGVANAFAAADMALAGIISTICFDEVILALKNTQELLPKELKGTTVGGLACTPTAIRIRTQLKG